MPTRQALAFQQAILDMEQSVAASGEMFVMCDNDEGAPILPGDIEQQLDD